MTLSEIVQFIKEQFPEAVVKEDPNAVFIAKEFLVLAAKMLKDSKLGFKNLHCLTAVDFKDHMDVVYHLYSFEHKQQGFMLTLKVSLLADDLNIETVSHLWQSANWFEREVYDLFGIKFLNHPDLRRILNPKEWSDHPLRKDFNREDFVRLVETQGLKGPAKS